MNESPLSKQVRVQRDFIIMMIPMVLVVGLFVTTAWPEDHVAAELAEQLGLFFIIFSMLGRAWTYLFLENKQNGLPVIQGPYRHMGYPLFFFATLALAGIGLMLGTWVAGLLMFVAGFILSRVFITRIRNARIDQESEEDVLYRGLVPEFFPAFASRIRNDGIIDQPKYGPQTMRLVATDLLVFSTFIIAAETFDWMHEEAIIGYYLKWY
jgi:protein-S-isoprenylcysteine O-methyltransferase Ste14